MFPSVEVASAVMPIIVIPLLAFGGFFINQLTLPWYFMPLKYASYFGYVFENMAINEWSQVEFIPGEYQCFTITYFLLFPPQAVNETPPA